MLVNNGPQPSFRRSSLIDTVSPKLAESQMTILPYLEPASGFAIEPDVGISHSNFRANPVLPVFPVPGEKSGTDLGDPEGSSIALCL